MEKQVERVLRHPLNLSRKFRGYCEVCTVPVFCVSEGILRVDVARIRGMMRRKGGVIVAIAEKSSGC